MRIEYLAGMQPQVEHVTAPELHRWTAEHPQAVIVHATPEPGDDAGQSASLTPRGGTGAP